MYDIEFLERLNNLKNLGPTKNSNITMVSKKNEFGDTVKFFAQIDSQEVVQKLSYKASGCTYFLIYCDYFCDLVKGKTIKESLKLNVKDLEKCGTLNEQKLHIAKIILDTFALLIKKYKKGIEKGIIQPSDSKKITKRKNTKKESVTKENTVLVVNNEIENKQKIEDVIEEKVIGDIAIKTNNSKTNIVAISGKKANNKESKLKIKEEKKLSKLKEKRFKDKEKKMKIVNKDNHLNILKNFLASKKEKTK